MARNNGRSKLFLALLALFALSFLASPVAAETALWKLGDDEFANIDDDARAQHCRNPDIYICTDNGVRVGHRDEPFTSV